MRQFTFLLLLSIAMPLAAQPEDDNLLSAVRQRPPLHLGDFEQTALARNPTLAQAHSLVKQSAGLARQAGLLPNPTVGYQGEQIRGGSYVGGEQGGFLQQDFVLGGKLGLRRNVYEQQRLGFEIGVTEQRQRVLADVDQQFYTALSAQELVNLRERLLHIALDAVETAHQLANVGQADAPDVLQSEVEAEQAKLDFTTAQRAYLQQFAILASLTGQPDLPPAPLAGNIEDVPSLDTAQLLADVLQNSPALKRAEQHVNQAQAQLKSAGRESIPDLQIRAGVQNNLERLDPNATNLPVGAQAFVTAGVTLPLFNRNQGNRTAAEAELENARAEVARVRLSLRQATEPAIQNYLSLQTQAARYKTELLPRAAKAHQLYLAKYQQMAAAYPQVLVSQRTLFQLQVAYLDILRQLWTSTVSLNHFLLSGALDPPATTENLSPTLNLPGSRGGGE